MKNIGEGAAGKTPTTPRPFAMLRVTKVKSRVTQKTLKMTSARITKGEDKIAAQ